MKFKLVVRPDGTALLTTEEELGLGQAEAIQAQFQRWKDGEWPVALIDRCAVVQVVDVELDLSVAAAV